MTLTSKMVWIGGILLAVRVASPAGPVSAPDPEPEIRIRLYDYAGVSPATLAKAKTAATQALERAGVHLTWAECRLSQEAPPKDPSCKLPITPADLQLRILSVDMARRTATTSECLGYALLSDSFDLIAAVLYHRALGLEKRNLADRAVILGAMMAHEIGHLLLEQSDHSGSGIMRASWTDEDLKTIAKGRMWFTAEQARRITSMAARRKDASGKLDAPFKIEE